MTGIHPYNPLEVYSRLPPPEIKVTPAFSNFEEYLQACHLLTGVPECQAVQSILKQLCKQVQTAEARITVLESKTQELEDELHKQRGGKHDRRVLTKARLATAEYLTACRQARDQEKENTGEPCYTEAPHRLFLHTAILPSL